MIRRQKYYNVRVRAGIGRTNKFECIRDAATWMFENGWSKSIGAARVGMSTVLTGKRDHYRGFGIKAERLY